MFSLVASLLCQKKNARRFRRGALSCEGRQGRLIAVDTLEERQMLSAQYSAEVRTVVELSRPNQFTGLTATNFTEMGGNIYFTVDGGEGTALELWKSDGTAANTRLVRRLVAASSFQRGVRDFQVLQDRLYFVVRDDTHGEELWRSDGTTAGTRILADLAPGNFEASPRQFTAFGGQLYFVASTARPLDVGSDVSLFRTTGPATGIVEVLRFPGESFQQQILGVLGTKLLLSTGSKLQFITASNSSLQAIKDDFEFGISIWPQGLQGGVPFHARIGNRVLFGLGTPQGLELWRTDGTANGTIKLRSVASNPPGDAVSFMASNGSRAYFILEEDVQSPLRFYLWTTDGTTAGTARLCELQRFNTPLLTSSGNLLFLNEGTDGRVLPWKSNGTVSGTVPFSGVPRSFGPGVHGDPMLIAGGSIYLAASGLWRIDTGLNRITLATESAPFALGRFGSSLVYSDQAPGNPVNENVILLTEGAVPAPTLSTPAATVTVSRPQFIWSAVPGAVAYDIWLKPMSFSTNDVPERVTSTRFTPAFELAIGEYEVRVRAFFSNSRRSTWSPVRAFEIAIPVTTVPVPSRQQTFRPNLIWNPLNGALNYDVEVDNVSTGQQRVIQRRVQFNTTITPTTNLPIGNYRFRVRGVRGDGVASTWSAYRPFSVVGAPKATAPLNNTFSTRPTFRWGSVPGAATYELMIRNAVTGATVLNPKGLTTTSWTPPAALAKGQYRWMVKGVNTQSFSSLWSATTLFFTGGQTTMSTPKGVINEGRPQFTWDAVDGAVRYELTVVRVGISTPVILERNLTSPSYRPRIPLASGQYRTWVRAVTSSGQFAPSSTQLSFQIVKVSNSIDSPLGSIGDLVVEILTEATTFHARFNRMQHSALEDGKENPWNEYQQPESNILMSGEGLRHRHALSNSRTVEAVANDLFFTSAFSGSGLDEWIM